MLLAFGAMLLLLVVAHGLVVTGQPDASEELGEGNVAKRRRGVKALVIGADGRASTSKLQAVLWTFAVFYAFIFLLVWGRSLGCGRDGLSRDQIASCERAEESRTSFMEVVGRDLQAEYYVLLGFPIGVAVAAKALTSGKVAAGTIAKEANEESKGVAQGLREVISNDRGETDLLDFQYFAFNLLTLAFFWIEFLTKPAGGLPDLPATLIGLSGLSAAAYTTRKALQTDVKPEVSAVIPRRLLLSEGTSIAVVGTGFEDREVLEVIDDQASPPAWVSPTAWVKVDGIPLKVESWKTTRIDAVLTTDLVDQQSGVGEQPRAAELVVDVAEGPPSELFAIELYGAP